MVLVKLFFVFIFIIVTLQNSESYVPQKIFLSVYYESKCPDSRAFVMHQLKPAIDLLPDYITLRLVPFGKAKSINNGYGGFTCQHGPSECLGNLVQECALDAMAGRSDAEKVDYVYCEMRTLAGTRGRLECVDKANISLEAVRDCVTSGKGTALQLDSEYLNKLVRPAFIPTVTIDGIFNQQIQDSSQVDLVGTICSILKETKQCAEHYNTMALKTQR